MVRLTYFVINNKMVISVCYWSTVNKAYYQYDLDSAADSHRTQLTNMECYGVVACIVELPNFGMWPPRVMKVVHYRNGHQVFDCSEVSNQKSYWYMYAAASPLTFNRRSRHSCCSYFN